jgi:four helix bundle protein
VIIYRVTGQGSLACDFGLIDQMRRSAVSIASNIAEGDERNTDKEAVRFFFIAKGSLAEVRTQLEIAHLVGYIDTVDWQALDTASAEIGKILGALIKARSSRQ